MGGENQKASLKRFRAILYAPFIGNPSYLPPNRNRLQKPIGGRSLLAQKTPKTMLKTVHSRFPCSSVYIRGVLTISHVKAATKKAGG